MFLTDIINNLFEELTEKAEQKVLNNWKLKHFRS